MLVKMDDSPIITIAQIKEFLKLNKAIKFKSVSRKGRYQWIDKVLTQFRYFNLRKGDKTMVKEYIFQLTGISDAQLTRLIAKKRRFGKIWLGATKRYRFPKKYTPQDITLLVKTDNLHLRLSGPATKEILKREYEVFGRKEYQNLKDISPAHIYNLRKTRQYQSFALTIKRTIAKKTPIGERKKPEPRGKPGYLRVDTCHQGDLGRKKGVYHINTVDEVTQWEIIACVERISEQHLILALEDILNQYPFVIKGFHTDNGSEYINKVVANLLNKLLIRLTKSRARHCNDNALVEGKHGSILRKHFGYTYIPQPNAKKINHFLKEFFNPYLNFHRPCGYPTLKIDRKGKTKKVYQTYQTPYERLKSLPNAQKYLKPGITFEKLDQKAYTKSDNEWADLMQKAKEELFKNFKFTSQEMMTFTTFISGSYVD